MMQQPQPRQFTAPQLTKQQRQQSEDVLNAEPDDEDVHFGHKLFQTYAAAQSKFAAVEEDTNCISQCTVRCDMENAFEVIEILILFAFIAFVCVWWIAPNNKMFLLCLAACCSVFGLLVLNLRRAQSCVRLHELATTLNDFRFFLFVLGLMAVVIADLLQFDESYLWTAHSAVWLIAGMLWATVDFANYFSYFVSSAYHIFLLICSCLEFVRASYQIYDDDDDSQVLYRHKGNVYSLNHLRIDGLCLMIMVQICVAMTVIRDHKREWYAFGLNHVCRRRLLQIAPRQYHMMNERMIQSQMNNFSGDRYNYLFGSNEDSLLLIWLINLSTMAYLSFFLWDLRNAYKVDMIFAIYYKLTVN